MSSGSTVFFFDFDIFSMAPMPTSTSPSIEKGAATAVLAVSMRMVDGETQPVRRPIGLMHDHALREEPREGLGHRGVA